MTTDFTMLTRKFYLLIQFAGKKMLTKIATLEN